MELVNCKGNIKLDTQYGAYLENSGSGVINIQYRRC